MTAPLTSGPLSVPSWPSALKDDTPLPYSAWRVMNLINGERTIGTVANQLGMTTEQVEEALMLTQNWVSRAIQREQVVNDATINTVSQCLMSVVGPVGEFMVDDALDEVGDQATLSALLGSIATQLDETRLHAFVRQLRSKGLA